MGRVEHIEVAVASRRSQIYCGFVEMTMMLWARSLLVLRLDRKPNI